MNLLGRDIPVRELLSRIEERLAARGLSETAGSELRDGEEPEARVEPLSFNLGALEEHSDPTRPMPLHTHRGGAGQLVVVAKWAFRKTCQVFINEALSRQRVFNGHVRDSYAQLSAEVLRLRREVEALKQERDRAVETARSRPARAVDELPAPGGTGFTAARGGGATGDAARAPQSESSSPASTRKTSSSETPASVKQEASREWSSSSEPKSPREQTPSSKRESSRKQASSSEQGSSRRQTTPSEPAPSRAGPTRSSASEAATTPRKRSKTPSKPKRPRR